MIFVWIPKTGGTTFSEMVTPKMVVITEKYECLDVNQYDHANNISFGHACPRQLLKHGIIPKWFWDIHTKTVIVRDPYTRFVSLYHDFKRTGRIDNRLTQRQFAIAIHEMDPVPGLYNSYELSQCAAQVEWLLPDMQIVRFEETFTDSFVHLNAGNHGDKIDVDAIEIVNNIYAADFAVLNYKILYNDHF